jgi:hypothetical protein
MSWATLSGFTGQTPNATKEARWPDVHWVPPTDGITGWHAWANR